MSATNSNSSWFAELIKITFSLHNFFQGFFDCVESFFIFCAFLLRFSFVSYELKVQKNWGKFPFMVNFFPLILWDAAHKTHIFITAKEKETRQVSPSKSSTLVRSVDRKLTAAEQLVTRWLDCSVTLSKHVTHHSTCEHIDRLKPYFALFTGSSKSDGPGGSTRPQCFSR